MVNGIHLHNCQGIWKIEHSDLAFVILCPKFCASTSSVETNHDRFFKGALDFSLSLYGSALRGVGG